MSYPHVMHLYGPWQLEALSRSTVDADGCVVETPLDLPKRARVKLVRNSQENWLPDWGQVLGQDYCGRVAYRRSFGQPSQLDDDERALLTTFGVDPTGEVYLNGRRLGVTRGYGCEDRFDVTELLERRNELAIEIISPPQGTESATPRPGREQAPGGLLAAARLEIVGRHWLDQLAVYLDSQQQLHVAGHIKSTTSDAALELVVIATSDEAARVDVQPNSRFAWSGKLQDAPRWRLGSKNQQGLPIHIQLHSGGSPVWQAERKVAWLELGANNEAVPQSMIHPSGFYTATDAAGVSIIQQVATAWRDEVCARLAHHPSITAWAATSEEISQLPQETKAHGDYGRTWIESKKST